MEKSTEILKKIKISELHLHLDGSLRPISVKEMLIKEKITIENIDIVKALSVDENNDSLLEYLKRFELPILALQSIENLERAAFELAEDLWIENYDYIEIRFAPHLHLQKGLSLEAVIEAVLSGMNQANNKFSLNYGVILCIMRNMDVNLGFEIVELAKKYKGKGVVGIDLAGDEYHYPVMHFKSVLEEATKSRLNITIHAGEAASYQSVKDAVKLGAKRIGHGIRAIEDIETMELLLEKDILLEMCPISNFQTKAVDDMKNYPIKEFLKRGIPVSVNSDNRTVSSTNIRKEIEFLTKYFDFRKEEVEQLIFNNKKYRFTGE